MSKETILWILFWSIFVVVSIIDYLVTSHRTDGVPVKTALRWTGLWVGIALAFGGLIAWLHPDGAKLAPLYITGYLTEYSLSIDNLFVFILIFSLMGVKEVAQPKLIKLGIYLSIALRILFIVAASHLVEAFHWLIYAFGALLVWTAWKMVSADDESQVHPDQNLLYKLASKFLPLHHEDQSHKRLFTRFEGRLHITPLFLVFLVIGSTDVLFAVDSIPAIMGICPDQPFVILTSNVFAVLGLNSLFFAIRGIMGLFKFLKHGVSLILFFIGAKMLAGAYGPINLWFKERNYVSLIVIVSILASSIVLSIWHEKMSAAAAAKANAPEDPEI
jgi:tellurite resistance protein TerC